MNILTAPAQERPCQLRTYHAPEPVITQGHHRHPIFLQNRVYGQIRDTELMWLCGTCHDSVHAWLYWLLGERARPADPGYLARREAQTTLDWWTSVRKVLL